MEEPQIPTEPTKVELPETTSTIKLTEKVFEIKAIGQQASTLLETVNEINGQLDAAKTLRRQNSGLLSSVEKQLFNSTFETTERAMSSIAGLVEPCRVEVKADSDNAKTTTKAMFVLRDSPSIPLTLNQLGLATQRLQTALNILCTREALQNAVAPGNVGAPPTYEDSQFMTASRARNLLRRASRNLPYNSEPPKSSNSSGTKLGELRESPRDSIDFSHASSPRSEKDELFFDQPIGQSSSPSPMGFRPYRPVRAESLQSDSRHHHNLPTSLLPGPLPILVDATGGREEPPVRTRGHSYPSAAPLTGQQGSTARDDSQGSAPGVADGFEEERQRMQYTPPWATVNSDRWSSPAVLPRIDVTIPNPEIRMPNIPKTSSNPPTPPTPNAVQEERSSGLVPSEPGPPLPMPDAPQPSKFPRVSPVVPPNLRRASAVMRPKIVQIPSPKAPQTRDWETLPSQINTSAKPPTFVVKCATPEVTPRPLFHNMLKLEGDSADLELVRQVSSNPTDKSVRESPSKVLVESEFPEVVTDKTLPSRMRNMNMDSEFPEAVPRRGSMLAPEPVSVVTEVPTSMMDRARKKREYQARLLRMPERAPEVVPETFPEAVDVRHSTDTPPLRIPPLSSTDRRLSAASSTWSLVPSTTNATTESNLTEPKAPPLSGRARSQRWRELQFERSQQLPKSS